MYACQQASAGLWNHRRQVGARPEHRHAPYSSGVRAVTVHAVTRVGRDPTTRRQQLQAPQHKGHPVTQQPAPQQESPAQQQDQLPYKPEQQAKQRQPPQRPQQEEEGNPPLTPSQVTRVRVEHDTTIRARRAYIWQLLQELCSPRWTEAVVVLATLESIYGVEFQSVAEAAVTSFQEAARQRVEGGEVGNAPLIAAEHYREAATVRGVPGFGGMELSAPAPPATGSLAASAANAPGGDAIDVDGDGIPDIRGAHESVMGSTQQAQDSLEAAQAAADAYFMEIVMLLSAKAHFVPVTKRDMKLCDSLNTDLLWQLFVRAYTRSLDKQLVVPHLKEKRLPEEAQHLLILKRGYGSESKNGRLLAQKLDYVQVLLVRRILSAGSAAVKKLGSVLRRAVGQPGQQQEEGLAVDASSSYGSLSSSSSSDDEAVGGGGAGRRLRGVGRELSRTGHDIKKVLVGWGILPRTNLIPLEEFDARYPIVEAPRLAPTHIERVSLPDVVGDYIDLLRHPRQQQQQQQQQQEQATLFGAGDNTDNQKRAQLLRDFFRKVMIVEPTFREALVIYRRLPKVKRNLLKSLLPGQKPARPNRWNSPITMRVYRDIPMPSWQVVFPDKLLQFRPLDLLRTDLFALVGVASALAQAKIESPVLQVVTLATVGVALSRLVLGFLRMSDRYRGIVSDLLRERTVASQEGAIEYLSASAALQQFKQTALAYTLLAVAGRPLGEEELAAQAEELLRQRLGLVIRFDAAEAVQELRRFGLLVEHDGGSVKVNGSSHHRPHAGSSAMSNGGTDGGNAGLSSAAVNGSATPVSGDGSSCCYSVVSESQAKDILEAYWAGLLRTRVAQIIDAFDEGAESQ